MNCFMDTQTGIFISLNFLSDCQILDLINIKHNLLLGRWVATNADCVV